MLKNALCKDPQAIILVNVTQPKGVMYMYRGGPSVGGIIYIIIGLIVAASHGYFGAVDSLSTLLNLLLAIFLWPLLLFGVSFNLNLGM